MDGWMDGERKAFSTQLGLARLGYLYVCKVGMYCTWG